MDEWVLALAGSPWVLVALYLVVTVDGFFPPVPSESAVIALAALGAATGALDVWAVTAVAAGGAFTGDLVAYAIGRRIPVRDLRLMRGPRAQRTVDWAERALAERGAAFIVAARYVPVGRVAVNVTAGTVRFPRRRFAGLAGLAAATWAVYSVALGLSAGLWLTENPLLAAAVAVVSGLLLGLAIDPLIRWATSGRRRRATARAGARAGATVDGAGVTGAVASASGTTARRDGAEHPADGERCATGASVTEGARCLDGDARVLPSSDPAGAAARPPVVGVCAGPPVR